MGYTVTQFQSTPNPNAVKCILDRPLPEPARSFRKAEEAAADPLGAALFSIPGITGVLLSGGWLTVNKSPDSDWPKIKKSVQDALSRAL